MYKYVVYIVHAYSPLGAETMDKIAKTGLPQVSADGILRPWQLHQLPELHSEAHKVTGRIGRIGRIGRAIEYPSRLIQYP